MKEQIRSDIRRTAAANDGKPFGWRAFEKETGIRYADWYGKYWKSWGDAVREAGMAANSMNARFPDDILLRRFVELTRELGRVPVTDDLKLQRQTDSTFPN